MENQQTQTAAVVVKKLVFTWNSPFARDTVVTVLFRRVRKGPN